MPTQPPRTTSLTSHFVAAKEPCDRLVVVLHGRGDSLEGFFWMPGTISLARQNYLLVNAPLPYGEGFAWYDMEDDPGPEIERGRARLRTLFDDLEDQGWKPDQIILLGFSQGSVMAADFALRYEKPLIGIVGISGYVYFPESLTNEINPAAKNQKWLITHGKYDTVMPVARTRRQMARLRSMGIKIEWFEFPKDHSIDSADEVALIRDWMMRQNY